MSTELHRLQRLQLQAIGPQPPLWRPIRRWRWRRAREAILATECHLALTWLRGLYTQDAVERLFVEDSPAVKLVRGRR